jgi:hypothetical protein
MTLSCSCADYEDADWYFYPPDDFSTLDRKRAVRCRSCGTLIKPGDECIKFDRFHYAKDEIEEKIYGEGEEIPIAPWFQCFKCGEMYLNLHALGFCSMDPAENVFALLREYHEMTGFKAVKP